MTKAPSALDHVIGAPAALVVALTSRRAVGGAVPRELHGLVASWMRAALTSGAVGDAHPPLHDTIVAVRMGAFALVTDTLWLCGVVGMGGT